MPDVIAAIPVDLERGRLGLPARVGDRLGGRTVLARSVRRAARVEGVARVVIVHPPDQDPAPLLDGADAATVAYEPGLFDPYWPMRAAARKWSRSAWRGGLGGMTCYDELLPAGAVAAAMDAYDARSAVLIGGDWPLVDPRLTADVLKLHRSNPSALKMTFCQAPPGLCGLAIGRDLVGELAANPEATIGHMLAYVPTYPQPDPIGRDVCVQIPGVIRSCARRFIYDSPASVALLERLDPDAEAQALAQAVEKIGDTEPAPTEVTLELTTRRSVAGPITPQHHVMLHRPDMAVESARKILSGLDAGAVVTLGGLGDALLHPAWEEIVAAAHEAGVLGVSVTTDLLVEDAVLDKLVDLPLDVVRVNVNADTAATYRAVMGEDRFALVVSNLRKLLEKRAARKDRPLTPWVVPALVKTKDTLGDLETFFDRWMHFAGHALLAPAQTGCGLMPEQGPVSMAPPRRRPCRQLSRRLTIHSDGRAALCDQDWLARATPGRADDLPLPQLWQNLQPTRDAHALGRWSESELCAACHEWHRP